MASSGVSLCLYYLAYNPDVMEKVCLLPDNVLNDLVEYALWLLEHSYESGRCHATMFFIHAFPFRAILELFDAKDGLRKLYNYISTLTILQENSEEVEAALGDDQLYQSRLAVRNVVTAFQNYFVSHLWVKADSVRRAQARQIANGHMVFVEAIPSFVSSLPPWKAVTLEGGNQADLVWALMTSMPMSSGWKPVEELRRLAGIQLLLRIVSEVGEWDQFQHRNELITSALNCLWIASVVPRVQFELSSGLTLRDAPDINGLCILLGCCEGEPGLSAEVQMAALKLLINCLCAPAKSGSITIPALPKTGDSSGGGGGGKRRESAKYESLSGEALLRRLWDTARANNGLMILRNLLLTKTPLTTADAIRALACRALDGLARCAQTRQMLSKMPLIAANELHWLMREPVLQDNRLDHDLFVRHAKSLIERVSGKQLDDRVPRDMTQETLWRNYVVYQTRINFNEKELLQLIHQYLVSKGFGRTAESLNSEAALPSIPASLVPHEETPHVPFPSRLASGPLDIRSEPRARRKNLVGGISAYLNGDADFRNLREMGATTSHVATSAAHPSTPLPRGRLPFSRDSALARKVVEGGAADGLGLERVIKAENSLEAIVTQYLRQQHATCPHPVSSCPPFSLLYKHHCPEPKLKHAAPTNLTQRFFKRPIYPVGGGYDGIRCDRRFVFSRFKALRSYKDPSSDETFTSCRFSASDEQILLGNYTGELKIYNVGTGQEEASHACHSSAINHVQQSADGRFLLTCSDYVKPMSAFWEACDGYLERKLKFDEDTFLEFGGSAGGLQDRILGTNQFQATVYDAQTGQSVVHLYDEASANRYSRNRAHFHPVPGEELILNDGCLWDARAASIVHKFDKLNPHNSGVFHPRGLQVIINTEVWDVRSFRLLHTVPALDQCRLAFNSTGDVIYGVLQGAQEDDFFDDNSMAKASFGSSFRTFDALDYTQIATVDCKRVVIDLAADSADTHVALIETHGTTEDQPSPSDENLCRLYEVGKIKAEDEEQDEEDVAGNDDDDDDDNDDDDDVMDNIVDDGETSSSGSSSPFSSEDEEEEGEEENAEEGAAAQADDGDAEWVTDEEGGSDDDDGPVLDSSSFLDVTYQPGTGMSSDSE